MLGSAALGSAALDSAVLDSAALDSAALGSAALGSAALGSAVLDSAALGSAALGSAALDSAVLAVDPSAVKVETLLVLTSAPELPEHPATNIAAVMTTAVISFFMAGTFQACAARRARNRSLRLEAQASKMREPLSGTPSVAGDAAPSFLKPFLPACTGVR
ncbi:hypothetical protein [Nakamurella antarctica]|uniref:hypothetical protein n=1 Tax=Nakamurella antarctica TaxID=1902245 RepID=UPI001EEFADEF|nr:hypothetical protein [Nakamurella antarctica]